VLVSPDNISHLPPGSPESHSHFITSAGIIALVELASALLWSVLPGNMPCKSTDARPTSR
jgi:hypothetical protein